MHRDEERIKMSLVAHSTRTGQLSDSCTKFSLPHIIPVGPWLVLGVVDLFPLPCCVPRCYMYVHVYLLVFHTSILAYVKGFVVSELCVPTGGSYRSLATWGYVPVLESSGTLLDLTLSRYDTRRSTYVV